MENSFRGIIEEAKSVLILLPNKPFFDQVAAGLSLYLSLRDTKEVQVACSTPMTVEFNRLIGVNKVSQELGNKNLVIRFSDYQANDIERVSYDIEDGQFRLTVIPKDRLTPPNKDQVNLSYSGVSADLIILVGGANEGHFPMLTSGDLAGTRKAHIGNKDLTLTSARDVMSFARPSASVSEITAKLIDGSGFTIDEDVATNLVMGIEEATNNFESSEASAETFEVFAMLMRKGGKRKSSLPAARPGNFPPGSIPGIPSTFQQQAPWQPAPGSYYQGPPKPQQQQTQQQQNKDDQSDTSAPKDWLEPKIFKGTSVK